MSKDRENLIVAIDGPAGSGKTTVARLVADGLKYRLVDTGALFRCLAYCAISNKINVNDEAGLAKLAAGMSIRFEERSGGQAVILNGQEVNECIRTPEISQLASRVSVHPGVRKALLGLQRDLGRYGGVVLEGRDIGTVVFPDAEVKIFLIASSEIRAERRFRELQSKGCQVELAETLNEMKQRDERDVSRTVAPLKPADDAILIDTSEIDASQTAQLVIGIVKNQIRLSRGKN